MIDLSSIAAILAAAVWAVGGLLAFAPARALGTYRFARIQIFTSAILVGFIAYLRGWLVTVDLTHWFALVISGLIGILCTNLAFTMAIRRGGPRRAEVLFTSSAVFSAVFGYVLLGEVMNWQSILACVIVMAGIILAVLSEQTEGETHVLERVEGSVWLVTSIGILAGLGQAIGLLIIKEPMQEGLHPVAATAVRLWVCMVALILYDLLRKKEDLISASPGLILKAAIPGFLGYVVASSLLLYALTQRNTAEVVVLGSLSPVMILPLQWLITRQRLGIGAYIGGGLAVIGTCLLVI
jgi:drug/metabolite transporter (DMT)-like permease|tara:strand:+ start:280 stop:1167 length:888 start_codon:yes stop_codon:yes gene_type:complete